MLITSIICSIPGYMVLFGMVERGSGTYIKMQLLFFCAFLLGVFISQSRVYVFDKRKEYYLTISLVGLLPYTVLCILCHLFLPAGYFELLFLPDLFLVLLGATRIGSILSVNLAIYVIVLIYPYVRRSLRGR